MAGEAVIVGGVERNFNAAPKGRARAGFARASADLVASTLSPAASVAGFPTWMNQLALQSCVEFSIIEQALALTGELLSVLYGFWYARVDEGERPDANVGLSIPEALEVGARQGYCLNASYPYRPELFAAPPLPSLVLEAMQRRITRHDPIADLVHLKWTIDKAQRAVLFGFAVPDTMEDGGSTERDGIVLYTPSSSIVGRHCVNAVKYDDARQLVGCTSHYGPSYGDSGLIWLPYAAWNAGHPADVADMFSILSVGKHPVTA